MLTRTVKYLGPAPTHTHTVRRRVGTTLVALSAVVAIGVLVLFVAITGANRTTTKSPSLSERPHSYAAPASVPTSPRVGSFRDPGTHALLRIQTTPHDTSGVRAEKSHGAVP